MAIMVNLGLRAVKQQHISKHPCLGGCKPTPRLSVQMAKALVLYGLQPIPCCKHHGKTHADGSYIANVTLMQGLM